MHVWLDGDGCPVVDIAVSLCKKYQVSCTLLCDTAHEIRRDSCETIVVDKGADSVDYALVNRISAGDLVITQDYGLASMCLAKQAKVLHQDGWEYTTWNIDGLLLVRHESRKQRSAGVRMKGPRKRSEAQNHAFKAALEHLIQTSVQG